MRILLKKVKDLAICFSEKDWTKQREQVKRRDRLLRVLKKDQVHGQGWSKILQVSVVYHTGGHWGSKGAEWGGFCCQWKALAPALCETGKLCRALPERAEQCSRI